METTESQCMACGQAVEPSWRHCSNCGTELHGESTTFTATDADLPVATDTLTEPLTSARAVSPPGTVILGAPLPRPPTSAPTIHAEEQSPRRKLTMAALAVGVILVAGLLVVGSWLLANTRSELQATSAELASTEQSLSDTETELADTSDQLEATRSLLESTESDLEDSQARAAELDDRLAGTETELEGVRGTLNETRGRVELQAGQIDTLQDCLVGVMTSLDYAADSDWLSAGSALEAVSGSCTRAFEMF